MSNIHARRVRRLVAKRHVHVFQFVYFDGYRAPQCYCGHFATGFEWRRSGGE